METQYFIAIILLIIASAVFSLVYLSGDLERTYKAEVSKRLESTAGLKQEILTEDDMAHLPVPVQKYLRYTGVVGKEKVHNFRAVLDGQMKGDPEKDWANIEAVQYNFFDVPARLFYIKMNMFGVPVLGLHSYTEENAFMHIKIAGLVTVLDSRGPEMRISDTVTLLNDMCLMAPAALIDKRIQWETIDPLTARAMFENMGCKVSAVLYFNEKGELVNFISDDRFMIPMNGQSRKGSWSTPVRDYKDFGGIRLQSYGEAIWNFPEGDYCYGKFNIKKVKYNCERLY
ncbi:hypothetical protein CUJ83_10085 [Methanocella sp. CWC-04]|uniref:Uncharacterized protein n=1 Tax=Methanooceanicella nereidis TaxID=2052831 RepID=A0AAP2W6H7_9EURY|nr:DUF6544 family protein [Methanocella sp. CWC-04]MCD1295348.1 hypothetical protein [Methanocella sp. CWC-04]